MSRHKHRSGSANTDGNSMMNNSLGINPQILQMLGLGNADMGQLSGLLGNMGQEGFNLNNLGSIANTLGLGNMNSGNSSGNNGGEMNMGNNGGNINPLELLGSLFGDQNGQNNGGNFNSNQNFANSNINSNSNMNSGNNNYTGEGDSNMAMLKAVRSMVDPQRCKFLDRVMELYKNGEINY